MTSELNSGFFLFLQHFVNEGAPHAQVAQILYVDGLL